VVGGLSGSGKSTLAAALAPELGAPPGARLIESDRVRKAMFGVEPGTRLPEDAYRTEVSDRVYATLASRAEAILKVGSCVVTDAVYDRHGRRAEIEAAAKSAGVPFTGIWLEAAPDVLMRRVAGRHGDVSDATTEVLRAQLERDPGRIDWNRVSADGTPAQTLAAARAYLGETAPGINIRYAVRDDVDPLVALETVAFETDRLSRRSFRDFIDAPTARLRVATIDGRLVGYALTTWRKGTGVARLYSIATDPAQRGTGVAARLLEDAEDGACQNERAVMRLEVGTENAPALALYRRAGYHVVERLPGYYEDGTEALRLEKPLRGVAAPDTALEYYQQTTEFTCGAACLMMALRAGNSAFPFDPVTEVRLWREATTIFMTSGLGGCEPYGMATVLAEHGLPVTIWTTMEGPLLLRTVQNAEKRRVMTLAQADFQDRIRDLGVPVRLGLLGVEELVAMLGAGAVAILLISGSRMFGKKVPHWVLAFAADEAHVFLHDPWVEHEAFETPTDAAAIPVPFDEIDRMWRWGADRLRAAVIAWPSKAEQSGR
jgi:predicted kinase/ribosomal protein S18 acetylase RimI-like enzyme/predicted peroxiredoxin